MFTLNRYIETQQNLSLPNLVSARTLNLRKYCVTVEVITHYNDLPGTFHKECWNGTKRKQSIGLGAKMQPGNAKSSHVLQENNYDAACMLDVRTLKIVFFFFFNLGMHLLERELTAARYTARC